MSYSFLLIGEEIDFPWPPAFIQTISALGDLNYATETEILEGTLTKHYDIVFIDAGGVQDPPTLIFRLQSYQTYIHIIVVTASPTWMRAREALKAGAVDYILKSLSSKELLYKIKNLITISPVSRKIDE